MNRLYVIVRADLPAGLQVAQSCHAVSEYTFAYESRSRAWHEGGKNIVVLTVPDEEALQALWNKAYNADVTTARFFEPDLNDELTAVAFGEEAQKLVSSLPLALRTFAVESKDGERASGTGIRPCTNQGPAEAGARA